MSRWIRFLPVILMVVLSCSSPTGHKDTGDDSGSGGGDVVASGTIDSGGGTLTADDIVVTIPSGALPDETSLTIRKEAVQSDDQNIVTPTYTLEGLPSNCAGDIEVRLKYSGALAQSSFIVLSKPAESAVNDSMITVCDVIDAVDVDGFLTAVIPAATLQKAAKTAAPYADFEIFGLLGLTNYIRILKGSRFSLVFPYEYLFFAQGVGDALDEAYNTGLDWGFEYDLPDAAGSTVDSVIVDTIFREIPDEDVEESSTRPILPVLLAKSEGRHPRIGYLKSAVSHIFDSEDRLDAISAFFELVFIHYGATTGQDDYFNYAVLRWIRSKLSTVQPYTPPGFTNAPLTVLKGERFVWEEDIADTGDAASVFIEYLDRNHDLTSGGGLASIYANIHGGDRFTEAVSKYAGDGENVWWPEFIRELLTDGLAPAYPVSASTVTATGNIAGSFTATESDTVETFIENYGSLESRLYRIQVSDAVEEQLDYVRFSVASSAIDNDYISVMVFGLKDGELRYIDHRADLGVSDIDEYTDDNTFYALVMNNAVLPQIWDTREIEFAVEAAGKETPLIGDPNTLSFSVSVYGEYTYKKTNFPDETKEYDLPDTIDWIVNGALDGQTFTGNSSVTEGDVTQSMSVTVDFDETFSQITSFNFSGSHVDASGDRWSIAMSASGGGIPYSSTYVGWRIYRLEGTDVCGAVGSMDYYSDSERNVLGTTIYSSTEMQGFTCSEDSFITIELKEQ